MKPTLGRIVHYRLTAANAERIKTDRTARGIQGNHAEEGDVYPLVITRMWGEDETSAFNGTLLLDGPDTLWITSTSIGDGAGRCFWPPRVE